MERRKLAEEHPQLPLPALQTTSADFHTSAEPIECPLRTSIVVVNYNAIPTIGPCLRSLVSTTDETTEIIVVDNGSTDGSAQLIAEFFPSVKLIYATNLGFGGGNNLGKPWRKEISC